MRISDWSSDVCSSDLSFRLRSPGSGAHLHTRRSSRNYRDSRVRPHAAAQSITVPIPKPPEMGVRFQQLYMFCSFCRQDFQPLPKYWAASERFCSTFRSEDRRVGKSVSVGVDRGGGL